MPRNRTITPDFWTWENVVACKPMTRLLFIGLWTFADNHGVMPLKACTIRWQVFPGDQIGDDRVRAMIDELAARKLVRIYEVEGLEYLAIADWDQHQRVPKRAKRRYPRDPSLPETLPPPDPLPAPVPAHELEQAPPDPASAYPVSAATTLAPVAQPERWRRMIKNLLRQYWVRHPLIELMDDATADRWTAKWIAEGCDFRRDVVPVVRDFCALKAFSGPPVGFQELDEHVAQSRALKQGQIELCRADVALGPG